MPWTYCFRSDFRKDAQYQPYDDISWCFPVNYKLDTFRIDDRAIMDVPVQLLTENVHTAGKVSGAGSVFLLADHGQESLLAARYRLSNFKIKIAEKSFKADGVDYPAGSWIISDQNGSVNRSKQLQKNLDWILKALPQFLMYRIMKHLRRELVSGCHGLIQI